MNPKRLAFDTLYDRGRVRVVVDLTVDGVVLPEVAHKMSPDGRHLPLDYSARFRLPRFAVTDEGLRADLTFGGVSQYTFVPWTAVMALGFGGEMMESWFPDDLVGAAPAPEAEADAPAVRLRVDARAGGPLGRVFDAEPSTFNLELDKSDLKWLAPLVHD